MKTLVSLLSALLVLASCGAAAAQAVSAAGEGTIWSRLDADLYGYVKLDACYDTSPVVNGDYAKWVAPGDDGADFSSTVNQTRVGLDVRGPDDARTQASGRVEIDFYGGQEDPDPRIRHAYVEISWPEAQFDLLVGQTSDVVSPLYPSTLNYTVAWWAGNIGFRRPQIRVTKRFDTKGPARFQLVGAVTHNIYDTKTGSLHGEDAGFPALQARASVTLPLSERRAMTIGLSGHRAEEDFEVLSGSTERIGSWSVNLDLVLPIRHAVTLKSELWSGSSLAPYLGGVGQGVDPATLTGLRSRGGWISVDVAPHGARMRYAFGLSLDDVDDTELSSGARASNRSVFGTTVYSLNKKIDLGVELSHWRTDYVGQGASDAIRLQTSFFYKF